jgi:curved DNA-binding protein CbpA
MDHYVTLGVNKNATPDDIKKAYRKLASKHHPDKGGDTSTFQKIEEAYRILSDPNQRQQYDNPAPHGFHFGQGAPEGFPFTSGGFADIFNMFQQHQDRQQRAQQQVFRTSVQATLQQVYFGEEQTSDRNIINIYSYYIKDNKNVKYADAGTFNIETGIMTLNTLYSDSDVQFKFIVNSFSNDVVAKRNALLEIDQTLTTTNIFIDEIARGGNSRSVDYKTFPKDR